MTLIDIAVLLFVTIGPIRAAIVYVGLTKSADAALKRQIAIRTVLTSTILCATFVFLGAGILGALKVTVPALLIAGGAILFVFALQMVVGEDKGDSGEAPPPPSIEIATFPLAVPLMASPQGLVAIVSIEAALDGPNDTWVLLMVVLALMAFNLVFLLFAEKLLARIPAAILKVVMRVVGLLLCSLAVQLMIFGFEDLGVIAPQLEAGS